MPPPVDPATRSILSARESRQSASAATSLQPSVTLGLRSRDQSSKAVVNAFRMRSSGFFPAEHVLQTDDLADLGCLPPGVQPQGKGQAGDLDRPREADAGYRIVLLVLALQLLAGKVVAFVSPQVTGSLPAGPAIEGNSDAFERLFGNLCCGIEKLHRR